MSLPAGHNPDASMLQGGEGVNIAPNQAGGGDSLLKGGEDAPILPSQAGGADPLDGLTDSEKDQVRSVAALVIVTNADNKFLSPTEVEENAIKAAETYGNQLLKRKSADGTDSDVLDGANEAEKAAAKAAVQTVMATDEFQARKPEEQLNDVKITALAAIMRERAKNNLKVVKAHEAAKATKMTTEHAVEIQALESTPIYTELYHITDINSTKELDKYRAIFQLKYIEMQDEVAAQKMRINMFTDVEKYKQKRIKQWNEVYGISGKKVNPIIPIIRADINLGSNEILTMFSRYIYSLKYELDTVIVIPPINGDTDKLVKIIYRLDKIGALTYKKVLGKDTYKIKAGLTIVFMPPFYANVEGDPAAGSENLGKATLANSILFSIFIDINRTNFNKIFILCDNTAENYNVGLMLTKIFTRSDFYKNSPLTMLEPSYIVYPYTREGLKDGFVISTSRDDEPSIPQLKNYGLADLKVNNFYGKPLGLAVKPDGSNTPENIDMFAIRSTKPKPPLLTFEDETGRPPGRCDGLLKSKTLDKYAEPFYLQNINISKVNGETDRLIDQPIIMVIKLNPNGDHAPLCTSALLFTPEAGTAKDLHKPSDKVDPNVARVQIDIEGRIYSIRDADEKVIENWKKQEFTKDEAAFLNATRLRPGILQGVFGDNWPVNLSNFLYTFTTSKCMNDNTLLTKRECYNCRKFLEDVNIYIINNSLQLDLQNSEFNKFADDVYNEDKKNKPPQEVDKDHAREGNEAERIMHKLQFGNISSYTNSSTRERRAFIISLNKKTGMYKYYVISVPSALTDIGTEEANKEEAELEKKVGALRLTYPDTIFIY